MTDWADNRMLQRALISPNLCKIPEERGCFRGKRERKGILFIILWRCFYAAWKPMQISVWFTFPKLEKMAKAGLFFFALLLHWFSGKCCCFLNIHWCAMQDLLLWRTFRKLVPDYCETRIVIDRSWRGKAAESLFFSQTNGIYLKVCTDSYDKSIKCPFYYYIWNFGLINLIMRL